MKIITITVGKKHDPNLATAIAEYEKRLTKYCDFSWQLIPSSDVTQESAAIIKQLKPDDTVILLDERGKMWANDRLAYALETLQNQSVKRLIFRIGGAYGVSVDVQRRANYILALSPLVFPHQIVRLLLIEQLYRTYSIMADGKYHHE
ncbi:MAG: 23S rRNA (pseudouridine(1915)-N(3))-methyltransferase RlmH [Candidatus Saccharimonadales bacterium]